MCCTTKPSQMQCTWEITYIAWSFVTYLRGVGYWKEKKTHSFPGRKKDLQNDKLRLRLETWCLKARLAPFTYNHVPVSYPKWMLFPSNVSNKQCPNQDVPTVAPIIVHSEVQYIYHRHTWSVSAWGKDIALKTLCRIWADLGTRLLSSHRSRGKSPSSWSGLAICSPGSKLEYTKNRSTGCVPQSQRLWNWVGLYSWDIPGSFLESAAASFTIFKRASSRSPGSPNDPTHAVPQWRAPPAPLNRS